VIAFFEIFELLLDFAIISLKFIKRKTMAKAFYDKTVKVNMNGDSNHNERNYVERSFMDRLTPLHSPIL
jgi:hypothetical protein